MFVNASYVDIFDGNPGALDKWTRLRGCPRRVIGQAWTSLGHRLDRPGLPRVMPGRSSDTRRRTLTVLDGQWTCLNKDWTGTGPSIRPPWTPGRQPWTGALDRVRRPWSTLDGAGRCWTGSGRDGRARGMRLTTGPGAAFDGLLDSVRGRDMLLRLREAQGATPARCCPRRSSSSRRAACRRGTVRVLRAPPGLQPGRSTLRGSGVGAGWTGETGRLGVSTTGRWTLRLSNEGAGQGLGAGWTAIRQRWVASNAAVATPWCRRRAPQCRRGRGSAARAAARVSRRGGGRHGRADADDRGQSLVRIATVRRAVWGV